MRYEIITNPVSGHMTIDQKRRVLAKPSEILSAEIHGLDTVTAEHFRKRARELAARCDVLVIAGGDGSLSDIINSINTAQTPIAYLPLGTGNAMRHALNYRGGLDDIALRIRDGRIYEYDLIDCDGKMRASSVSIGLEGTVIRLRNQYRARGATGFKTYFRAVINSYFKEHQRTNARISVDGTFFEVKRLLSLMVVKHPYYGFGMNVVPKARFDDRHLHIVIIKSGFLKSLIGAVSALTIGNRIGQYRTGRRLRIKLEHASNIQIDGNEGWEADSFAFEILPKALKIKH